VLRQLLSLHIGLILAAKAWLALHILSADQYDGVDRTPIDDQIYLPVETQSANFGGWGVKRVMG
jgi:hypothetical protein